MEYNDLVKIWGSLQKIEKGVPQSHYTRKVVDFSQPRNQGRDVIVKVYGDYITKSSYGGNVGDCTLRISHRDASEIPLTEFKRSKGVFSSIILTSTDTSGSFVFYIGGAWSGEIETASGDTVGVLNAAGVSINPSEKDEYDTVLGEIKTATEFGGNVYSKQQTSTNALVVVGATKLRDVVIRNNDAANAVDLGESQVDVATFRAQSIELAAGGSIGFTQVNLATLYLLSSVAGSHAAIQVIGVEI